MLDIGYLFASASVVGYIVARVLSNIFNLCIKKIILMLPFPLDGNKGWIPPSGFVGFRHKKLRK